MIPFRSFLAAGLLLVAGCNTPSTSPSRGPYELSEVILDLPWTEWKIVQEETQVGVTLQNTRTGVGLSVFADEGELIIIARLAALDKMMALDKRIMESNAESLATLEALSRERDAIQQKADSGEAGARELAAALTDREFLDQVAKQITRIFKQGHSPDLIIIPMMFGGHPAILIKGTMTAGGTSFIKQYIVFKTGLRNVRITVDGDIGHQADVDAAMACIKPKQ